MITDKEAKNLAAKIRRGKDSHDERVAYNRWAQAGKGRRPRTQLGELLADRRKHEAAQDLLRKQPRSMAPDFISEPRESELRDTTRKSDMYQSEARADGPGFDPPHPKPPEPPIAPQLPLDGELVDPIAPPIDLPEATIGGFDLGTGLAKVARAALEALDADNPKIGGFSLAAIDKDFWSAWEAATQRVLDKHVGRVNVADDELMVGGAVVVVAQPIAIPYVKEHGPAWLEKIKRAVGFGGAT